MDLGNAPEYARHSESSGTDAGRQRVLGRDAGILHNLQFRRTLSRRYSSRCYGVADQRASSINPAPKSVARFGMSELVPLQLVYGIAISSEPNPEHSQCFIAQPRGAAILAYRCPLCGCNRSRGTRIALRLHGSQQCVRAHIDVNWTLRIRESRLNKNTCKWLQVRVASLSRSHRRRSRVEPGRVVRDHRAPNAQPEAAAAIATTRSPILEFIGGPQDRPERP